MIVRMRISEGQRSVTINKMELAISLLHHMLSLDTRCGG